MKNFYITAGTYDFLKIIQQKYPKKELILMQNSEHTLLVHETTEKSIFQQPRKYEIIDEKNAIPSKGFVFIHYIPVSYEGRPLFEYESKKMIQLLSQQEGILTTKVLRPKSGDKYMLLTIWNDESTYNKWNLSKLNNIDATLIQFSRQSYKQSYRIIENK